MFSLDSVSANAASHARTLLEEHEEATGDGYRASTYPLILIRGLANSLAAHLDLDVIFTEYNLAQAFFIARQILAATRDSPDSTVYRLEVLEMNWQSASCGNWVQNPSLTGPTTDDENEARRRADDLAREGYVVRCVSEDMIRTHQWATAKPWDAAPARLNEFPIDPL